MKLHVVFNTDGDILAAAEVDPDAALRARPLPDERARHRAADVYVPVEYGHYDLAAVCSRLRVETGREFPYLSAKD